MQKILLSLRQMLEGELLFDELTKHIYATDASVYREVPTAVAFPKHERDVVVLVKFAGEHGIPLIPRTAGTSLAGQCVGSGIVVDVSKYMTKILEINAKEAWVRVQPGVIRDELNHALLPHGLWFGPNTSTANRCMIGGMVGNNSCGSTSIIHGSTRDHVLQLRTVLSDGSVTYFEALNEEQIAKKGELQTLEGEIYRGLKRELSDAAQQAEIVKEFPKANIHRRNTGYAVDLLLDSCAYSGSKKPLNLCTLLAGSEGTLAFSTEIKLNLVPLPAPYEVVVCPHFSALQECMHATQITMQHQPEACEMMDKYILDATKGNIEQSKNRFFVEGDPAAVLMVEFRGASQVEADAKAEAMMASLKNAGLGYAFPLVRGAKTKHVWDLRKAGLGLKANIPGDAKAVACIEDTAVALEDLPAYIADFEELMHGFHQKAVYYAHAGAGELHISPMLDLKKSKDVQDFHDITEATARLVKKYNGSLSGEHGDGRVRAEFIPLMLGDRNYALLRRVKQLWDPRGIFNPGKIVDAPNMTENLRYVADAPTAVFDTVFDFSENGGILQLAEKCSGSGDCRKLTLSGGTLCPSYRATRNEKDSTRGRANALREFLTQNAQKNAFDQKELKEVMDLCLSCKACITECPSSIDMTTLKAEWQHQYYQSNGVPLRTRAIANIANINRLAAFTPRIANFFLSNQATSTLLKSALGVASKRSLPLLSPVSLRSWYQNNYQTLGNAALRKAYLFCDEFTNYNDAHIGIKAIQLLRALGYEVLLLDHADSGRAQLSKGMLLAARLLAERNIEAFYGKLSDENPLIGIEPSAILSFRDEYPKLVRPDWRERARVIAPFTKTIDEFLSEEIQAGRITSDKFTKKERNILLHGHCHQKALSNVETSVWLMSLPENYSVQVIPSGCCGMAGSFGYEREHYDVSMQVGESVLFPAIRKAEASCEIAAPGTSCRHQIADGTGRKALHPVEVLWGALV